jgi:antitoxin (DNA-binding transcriptional repressor) of toxin-antitoxin stability system
MATVTISVAKADLSRLIERAAAGEEIVILRGKTPVARLTAIASKRGKRRFGAYRGEFEVPDSFFDRCRRRNWTRSKAKAVAQVVGADESADGLHLKTLQHFSCPIFTPGWSLLHIPAPIFAAINKVDNASTCAQLGGKSAIRQRNQCD